MMWSKVGDVLLMALLVCVSIGAIFGAAHGVRDGVAEVLDFYGGTLKQAYARNQSKGARVFLWYELVADGFGWSIYRGIQGAVSGAVVGIVLIPVEFVPVLLVVG